jgi:hypothetical protein
MDKSIAALLSRNLLEVFGERDASKRRAAMMEIMDANCLFVSHEGVALGYDAIDQAIATIHAKAPDFIFSQLGTVQTIAGSGRIAWGFGRIGQDPLVTGQDFILVEDKKISALYTFLDPKN